MKRGLVTLDPAQVPLAAYGARIEALRGRLGGTRAEVALVYGDVSRSADINFLSNLCLYWNEAILVVPRKGDPALITKLSKRVTTWMRETSVLADIRSGPRLTESIGTFLQDRLGGIPGALALVDLPWWPNNLVTQLGKTFPDTAIEDLGPAVREARLRPSAEELTLLQTASRLLDDALTLSWAEGSTPDERTSIAVRALRRAGFQEASVSCGRLGDGSEFTDAIGQFRDVWLRRSRPRAGVAAAVADSALQGALAAARPGMTEGALARLAAVQIGSHVTRLRCYPHADLETRGLYRNKEDADRRLREGEVVCLELTLVSGDGVILAADTAKVGEYGASPLSSKESP
jgi:Xaa-Pro aminopeptidase